MSAEETIPQRVKEITNTYDMKFWEQYGAGWVKDCKHCKRYRRQVRKLIASKEWFSLLGGPACLHRKPYSS